MNGYIQGSTSGVNHHPFTNHLSDFRAGAGGDTAASRPGRIILYILKKGSGCKTSVAEGFLV